jgi:hypothetical protein
MLSVLCGRLNLYRIAATFLSGPAIVQHWRGPAANVDDRIRTHEDCLSLECVDGLLSITPYPTPSRSTRTIGRRDGPNDLKIPGRRFARLVNMDFLELCFLGGREVWSAGHTTTEHQTQTDYREFNDSHVGTSVTA